MFLFFKQELSQLGDSNAYFTDISSSFFTKKNPSELYWKVWWCSRSTALSEITETPYGDWLMKMSQDALPIMKNTPF